MPPEVCFGANTSCLSITQIGSATKRPANVVGMHLMNPVHLKPTVEVIRGFHTSDQTIETLLQLFCAARQGGDHRRGSARLCLESHLPFVHERGGLRPAGPGGDCRTRSMRFSRNASDTRWARWRRRT